MFDKKKSHRVWSAHRHFNVAFLFVVLTLSTGGLREWGEEHRERKDVDQLSLWCSSKCGLISIPVAIHNPTCVSGDPMRRWSAMLRSRAECVRGGSLQGKKQLVLPSHFNVLRPKWFINQKYKIYLQHWANHGFSKNMFWDLSQFLGAHSCCLFLFWLSQRNSFVSADAFLEIKKNKNKKIMKTDCFRRWPFPLILVILE